MPDIFDFALADDPLKDPMFLVAVVIAIIAIVVSAIIGTVWGRKKKAEVEARIAERRKQRRAVQEASVAREKEMLKRYEDAKKRAEEEARTNPRPVMPVEDIRDEEVRPVPRGGGSVQMVSSSGPRFMKVQGELGVSGSSPVRLSTRDTVGVQGSNMTDTGETTSARVAKAKTVAAAKAGPPKPAVAAAKPVQPKPGPIAPGPPKAEAKADLEKVKAEKELLAKQAADKEREEKERIAKEAAEKERAEKEEPKKEKAAAELIPEPEEGDPGLDKLHEMLSVLDKMKKE